MSQRMQGNDMNRNRPVQAFTLIELLVVIGIIMVLMALLFPALSTIQERADKVKCLNNVRQIAIGAQTLFGESGSKMPGRGAWDAFGEAAAQLLPYVKNVVDVFDCPANPGNEYLPDARAGKCQLPAPNDSRYTDYEMNGYLSSLAGTVRSQSLITDFSQAAYTYDLPYAASDGKLRAHKGGANVGYLDGHAAFLLDANYGSGTNVFFLRGHQVSQVE